MGRYTCAYNCDTSSDPDVKFFKFPLYNPRKLKKWVLNMKWKDWTPTRFSVLCINHFEEQYIDKTGKSVTLREDAVPTIFTPTDNTQKKKAAINPRRKRHKQPGAKSSEKDLAASATSALPATDDSVRAKEPSQTDQETSGDPKTSEKWRIIIDEALMKIDSFPHFFHGDYCVPQSIHWAPDNNFSPEDKDNENIIEVKEPWEWLALDVRGPLPQTVNGHKYILTVTDFYSKWVEAVPMTACLPSDVAKNVVDIIAHFGYPLRILSRLPLDIVHKINRELKDQLKVAVALVVYHQQTGIADMITPQLIDRMVNDLIEEHAADWDVYLPAKVFSLCFKEHSETEERPFSVLCCKGIEPVQFPRELDFPLSKIRESAFVVR
ncbi:uncharacterized protein zgc:153292 [Maylandia zebra]|uniref:THAP domain-containing protein 1 n=1 Tax=Maylandia zebra TaxID=106582 RepID=A0A3P9D9P4_9CICH|nr:uncharacterized protein LOC101473527 [Maylandia zebra]XP_026019962.1 uncharacterized protein LOC113020323 isoform X1 [Astatotilapia calliptera]XP_026019963.1 uncharacterized protein LOC113020323 isoform X1 [Astatotilapia calliptera]XP_026019964.1 uncharacterized protein LOC113020323 isoform X1 [Astatotilapia calliptera]XP_039899831.1 uncharacterized protein zgc:153292 isoform X2 [Simochromis diagramma]